VTTIQRELLQDCIASDAHRLIDMCRRLARRQPPSLSRTRLMQITEHLELLIDQTEMGNCMIDDLPESY
jgi:hypothetical protein